MLIKHQSDHKVVESKWCGEIREILRGDEYSPNVAIAIDIRVTIPHFHRTFEEVYFVLDGSLELALHDPSTGRTWKETLGPNELCVISRNVHHGVTAASEKNRLCVLTVPRFDARDETTSDVLGADTAAVA